MTNQFQTVQSTIEWLLEQVKEFEKAHNKLMALNTVLEEKVMGLEKDQGNLVAQNKTLEEQVNAQRGILQEKVIELEETKSCMEGRVGALQKKNEQLQSLIDKLQGSNNKTMELTHRNILYSEEKNKKRLPVRKTHCRGADEVGSLVFGECFAVATQKTDGQDVWLQIDGGHHANQWVLGCDAGTVNCVDMTKYDREKYRTRIQSSEYQGQDFPKKMHTEGFLGWGNSDICLVSASGDSFWREVNIEMLLRGIATATVYEQGWGGDETFTDWVAYYAVNCVQYGQLRTPRQKRLTVTVKPTSRWREYQVGSCLGPDLDQLREDIGKAQYKECCWLKGMKEQLHVTWEEVEFVTAFAFLRAHCAWTLDDCKQAANDRFVWVLQEFFAGGYNEKALYELERAYWLWDEAFAGCSFDETARTMAYTELQQFAQRGVWLAVPHGLHTAGAAPLAWFELAVAATASQAPRLCAGGYHSLQLDTAGKLRAWGRNNEGQCSVPTLARGESWAAVSAGFDHSLGLTAGVLHTWGSNSHGQCSHPPLALGECWAAMSAGGRHSLGLTSAGTLHAWGENIFGQCTIPELPSGEHWAAVSAGFQHSLGLTGSGKLHAWGRDDAGQCSAPQSERWDAVSAGAKHSLGLTATGELHAWGDDYFQQCSGRPTLPLGEHWTAISTGDLHSLGLTSAGTLHAWGKGTDGRCKVPGGSSGLPQARVQSTAWASTPLAWCVLGAMTSMAWCRRRSESFAARVLWALLDRGAEECAKNS